MVLGQSGFKISCVIFFALMDGGRSSLNKGHFIPRDSRLARTEVHILRDVSYRTVPCRTVRVIYAERNVARNSIVEIMEDPYK